MTLDWHRDELAEGLGCYRRGEYFLAHEHWESVWLRLDEPEKSFLQALIQVTAAFHHLDAGNRAGTASLLQRALRRLERSPAQFGGIEVAALRAEISERLRALESGEKVLPAGPPRICPGDQLRGSQT